MSGAALTIWIFDDSSPGFAAPEVKRRPESEARAKPKTPRLKAPRYFLTRLTWNRRRAIPPEAKIAYNMPSAKPPARPPRPMVLATLGPPAAEFPERIRLACLPNPQIPAP